MTNENEHTAEGTTEVHVEVTPEAQTEQPTEHVTVVDTGGHDNGIHPDVAKFMADQAAENERLRAELALTVSTADDASLTASTAAATVDGAVEEVQAVGAEVSATIAENREPSSPDNDIPPKHSEHKWYRKRNHGA